MPTQHVCVCAHTQVLVCMYTKPQDGSQKENNYVTGIQLVLSQAIMLELWVEVGVLKNVRIVIIHQQRGFLVHEELSLKIL